MLLKLECWATVRWKRYDDMLSPFHTIPACHGQTDGRTDGRTDGQTELLYQYRASVCWRAIKTVLFAAVVLHTANCILFIQNAALLHFHLLPAGSARTAALPVLFLPTSRFLGFRSAARKGDTLHRPRWNLAGIADPLLPAKFHLGRFRGGVYGPKNWKNGILPI